MSTDPRIRVIKLAQRERRATARVEEALDSERHTGQDKTGDAKATVTEWVDELRRQKRESTGTLSAFNDLFEDVK